MKKILYATLLSLVVLLTLPALASTDETRVLSLWDVTVTDASTGKNVSVVDANMTAYENAGWTVTAVWSKTFYVSYWDGTKDVPIADKNGWVMVYIRVKKSSTPAPAVATAPVTPAPTGTDALPVCAASLGSAPSAGWVRVGTDWVPASHPSAANGSCRAQ